MRVTSSGILALPLAVVLGCSNGAEPASPIRSDSLGVSVIEYDDELGEAAGPRPSLDTLPLFSVGRSAPELHQVRTARFLSDGSFVVANGGSGEIILFDPAGRLVARAGGQGEGPGEFRDLASLSVGLGDSLFAYDGRQRRVSVFDPMGQLARSVRLGGSDSIGRVVQMGVLGTGQLVGAVHRMTPGPGLVRDSLIVMTFATSGEPERRLGVFPHSYTDWGPHPNPGGGGTVMAPLPVPFSSVSEVAMGAASVFVGLPEHYGVIRLGLDGSRRVTRQRQTPPALTEAHKDRLFGALVARGTSPQELDIVRQLQGPMTLPGFGFEPLTARTGVEALLVTDAEEVWLHPFQLPDDSAPAAWLRLDAEGLYQGAVTMPARCRATDVREDVVLGVCRDADDVESVQAYRLR